MQGEGSVKIPDAFVSSLLSEGKDRDESSTERRISVLCIGDTLHVGMHKKVAS